MLYKRNRKTMMVLSFYTEPSSVYLLFIGPIFIVTLYDESLRPSSCWNSFRCHIECLSVPISSGNHTPLSSIIVIFYSCRAHPFDLVFSCSFRSFNRGNHGPFSYSIVVFCPYRNSMRADTLGCSQSRPTRRSQERQPSIPLAGSSSFCLLPRLPPIQVRRKYSSRAGPGRKLQGK